MRLVVEVDLMAVVKVSNRSKRFGQAAATVLVGRAELGSFSYTDNRGIELK